MQQNEPETNEESKEEQPIREELNFEKPDFIFLPKGNHLYKQSGYYLICYSCDLQHAVFIGKDRVMVGEEEGQPIIKTRKELGMA